MDFTNYFEHHGKKIDKAHFVHLIQVAKADGKIEAAETEFLHRVGKRFGFTDPEIDKLISVEDSQIYTPPFELQKKFDQMYDVVAMLLADEVITDGEMNIARKFAVAAGFHDDEIERLLELLIDGLRNNLDEDDLFASYKKKIFKIR